MVSAAQLGGRVELHLAPVFFGGEGAGTKVSVSHCCPECLPCTHIPFSYHNHLVPQVGLKVASSRKPSMLYSTSWSPSLFSIPA